MSSPFLMMTVGLVRLVMAVGLPVLTLLAVYYGSFYIDNGFVIAGMLVGLAMLWIVAMMKDPIPVAGVITAGMMIGVWYAVGFGAENWVLNTRGVTTSCLVLDESHRVVSSNDYITTMYDYRVDCAGDVLDSFFSRGSPVAEEGERIEITSDPLGVMRPQATAALTSSAYFAWSAGILTGLAILIRLAVALAFETRRWHMYVSNRRSGATPAETGAISEQRPGTAV